MKLAVTVLSLAAICLTGCQFGGKPAPSAIDHYVAAQLQLEDGANDDALAELFKAVEIDPDLAAAHEAIGMIYQWRQDYKAASVSYSRALALNPYNEDVRSNLATCYDQIDESDKAEAVRKGLAVAE